MSQTRQKLLTIYKNDCCSYSSLQTISMLLYSEFGWWSECSRII